MSDGTVRITILFFAGVREAVGCSEASLEVPDRTRVADLVGLVCSAFPAVEPHRRTLRVAINEDYAAPERPVADGDEVALIPPVCGG